MVLVSSNGDKDGGKGECGVDFRGNPADKSKTGGWLAAGLILGTELSERICVMGISMNLVTYLVGDLHIPSSKSATIVTNFMGTLNLLGLLGGFLADAKLGRYLTIAIFSSVTALGVTLLTLSTTISSMRPPPCDDYRKLHHQCIEANGQQLALLYAALYTIALGGGGIKSNVSGFGSDQFDSSDPKEEKAMIFFFNRFYFCISIGSLFAVIVLVYVQDNVGRGWGYGISAGTMVIAVAVLLIGTQWYRFKKPQGSPLTVIWRVVFLAWKKRGHEYPSHPSLLNDYNNSRVPHSEKFKCLDKAAIVDDAFAGRKEIDPWIVSTVMEVEEVKMVLKLFPIWSTCIMFWTVYSQMTTFTVEQATVMDRKIGSFLIPAARTLTHNTQGLTSLQRIGIGLIFSVIAMVAAATTEIERKNNAIHKDSKISVFWLLPQFILVGAGEAFAYVGQLEFFIREAPERMKSLSTGFFLSTLSMGFFVSSLLVSLVDQITKKNWLRSNLNKGKLYNFYWLLAVLGCLNFLVFIVFARKHQYKVKQYVKPDDLDAKELKASNDLMVVQMEMEGTPV
ncbi:Major facilitator superfamily protein [Euphorbia peplus]|nr:Major facilitator superfamily protein [Euphorbia peplus]